MKDLFGPCMPKKKKKTKSRQKRREKKSDRMFWTHISLLIKKIRKLLFLLAFITSTIFSWFSSIFFSLNYPPKHTLPFFFKLNNPRSGRETNSDFSLGSK